MLSGFELIFVMVATLTYVTAGIPAPAPGFPVRDAPGPGLPPHHRGGYHGTGLLATMAGTGALEPEMKQYQKKQHKLIIIYIEAILLYSKILYIRRNK